MLTKEGHTIQQQQNIRGYYQFQSTIYDATRWSFLFGRNKVLDLIPRKPLPEHILEVGCGTGYNISQLAKKFPSSTITGVDVSTDMLAIAQKKHQTQPNIRLLEMAYANGQTSDLSSPDVILFSYVLTMINPQYPAFIRQAYEDLQPGGKIAVVDFHSSNFGWFKRHMGNHHVKMEGHLDGLLKSTFSTLHFELRKAYGGIWNYFFFIGEKR